MNKIEALINTRNHWYIMEITGHWDKGVYKHAERWIHECACCEYVLRNTNIIPGVEITSSGDTVGECMQCCPLTGYAWDERGCVFTNSPYCKWSDVPSLPDKQNTEERKKYGREMLYCINLAITAYYTKEG